MATVKIVLREKTKKDGTYPLCMRITKDRKTSFIHLGYSLKKSEWDAVAQRANKTYASHVRLNNLIIKKLSDGTNSAFEMEANKAEVSVSAVKNRIKPAVSFTFNAQAEAFLEKLKTAGKYNQYTADKPRVKHFRQFAGSSVAFHDITPSLLERFKAYLKGEGLSERSVVNHLVVIRSVFSQAIADNIVDAKYYPFGKGKIKIKFPESVKIGLNEEEVKALEEADLSGKADHARNLFLFSFYLAGIRASDVFRLKWADIQDNRLHYTIGKNNKADSLKLPDKAARIIEKYAAFKDNKVGLLFPDLIGCDFGDKFKLQRSIAFMLSATDKVLRNDVRPVAGITKPLTMHIARHTFGNLSGDKIPVQMLQKLYRHTSITTTIGYQQNFIHKDKDDALNSVIDF